jgi:hypothetical protein
MLGTWHCKRSGSIAEHVANYWDEDFMGRIKRVSEKTSGGGLVHATSIVLQTWRKDTWLSWEALHP